MLRAIFDVFFRYGTNTSKIYVRSSKNFNMMMGGDIPILINFNKVYAHYDAALDPGTVFVKKKCNT
jgi:hypothetical protein